VGKKEPPNSLLVREVPDNAALAVYLVEAFGWGDRVSQLQTLEDLPALLGPTALSAMPEPAKGAFAYLVREQILPSPRGAAKGGTGPADPVSRAVLAAALHRMILRYEATGLHGARYRGFKADAIGLQEEGNLSFHPIARRLHLAIKTDGESLPVAEHLLQDGDTLEYHLSGPGEVDYILLKPNSKGASDDRFSGLYSWETRITRADLATRIRTRSSIGDLVDLVPGRRGPSGRIVEMVVEGTAGRFTYRGFAIESLLGLRETLFLIDRQYGADGKVETFIFAGKGWGHGVGMCQVGAYGMALRGRTYEEILHHYYTGVTLQQIDRR
ncbi:MAG TPA: hypothetical protein VFG76_02820, partial [Candidatus Polarisedimenticolia bacterium]|nr:hypothetical protein [Candidatus Polarisedimenticolia bacterium]